MSASPHMLVRSPLTTPYSNLIDTHTHARTDRHNRRANLSRLAANSFNATYTHACTHARTHTRTHDQQPMLQDSQPTAPTCQWPEQDRWRRLRLKVKQQSPPPILTPLLLGWRAPTSTAQCQVTQCSVTVQGLVTPDQPDVELTAAQMILIRTQVHRLSRTLGLVVVVLLLVRS